MKKFFRNVWKTPMFLIFLLIFLFFGLEALGSTAEVNRFAIVTTLGVDMSQEDDSKYEISLLTFIPVPEQNFIETYKVITTTGNTIAEAIDFAGLYMGREVGLSHLKTIVLSEGVFDEDVTKVLDCLTRDKEVSSCTKLIATDGSAKDFLEAMKNLNSQTSLTISQVVTFNERYLYATGSSLESFFNGYFSPTKASVVPVFSLEENGNVGLPVVSQGGEGGGSSGEGGSGGESQGQSSSQSQIVNSGDAVIFKNGHLMANLTAEDMTKINYFRGNFNRGIITLEDFEGEPFGKADLSFEVSNKKIRNKVVFENGIPVIYTDIKLTMILSEVGKDDGMYKGNVDLYNLTKHAEAKIEEKIKSDMADAVEIMRATKTDVANFYTKMHNASRSSFNRFLKSLDDKEDYLNHILFKVNVDVRSK